MLCKASRSSSLSEYQHNLFLELYIWMFKKLPFPSQICKGKNNLERYETVARSRFQTLSTFANVESSFCHIEWYLIRIEAMVRVPSLLDPASWTPCPCWPSLQPRWFSRRQLWWSLGRFPNHWWSLIINILVKDSIVVILENLIIWMITKCCDIHQDLLYSSA